LLKRRLVSVDGGRVITDGGVGMRRKLALVAATVVASVSAIGVASIPATVAAPVAVAKSCSAGYTTASIGGETKCLRRGQFCSMGYASQYPRYGYRCVNGRLQ
jgi:hypothetical protein